MNITSKLMIAWLAVALSAPGFGCGDKQETAVETEKKPVGEAAVRLFYETLCKEKRYDACRDFGQMTRLGRGGPKDVKEGDRILTEACDHGSYLACEDLDRRLPLDEEIAMLQKDCTQKIGFSCNRLGLLMLRDSKKFTDHAKVRSVLEIGCDAHYAQSCDNLGRIYKNGYNVEKNDAKAKGYEKKVQGAWDAIDKRRSEMTGSPPRNKLPTGKPAKWLVDQIEWQKKKEAGLDAGPPPGGDKMGHDHSGHAH